MASLILFNKPYGVLSQFTAKEDRPTLAHYIRSPPVYPAGRLDHDSEGLLLLTDDGDLQHHISHPAHKQPKTYWVQVEGAPNSYALTQLRQGVALNDGITQPAEVRLIPAPKLWERDPPIRSRANIPTQWVEIIISEGKNRQVRRMTAAVGHPTLRLVRVKIGPWTLEGLEPGKYRVETLHMPKSASKPSRPGRAPIGARASNQPGGQGKNSANPASTKPRSANSGAANSGSATPSKSATQQGGRRADGEQAGKSNFKAKTSAAKKPATTTKTTTRAQSKPATKTLVIQKPKPRVLPPTT